MILVCPTIEKETIFFLIGKNNLNEKCFSSCLGRNNKRNMKKYAECFDEKMEKMMWFTYLHQGKCSLLITNY